MISSSGTTRAIARLVALALAGAALAACEGGPKLSELAPKMPKLRADVPETRHPEKAVNGEFPNINLAPDRPSVVHTPAELSAIEQQLETQGESHVKQAVGAIEGGKPAAAEEGGEPEAAPAPAPSPEPPQTDTETPPEEPS